MTSRSLAVLASLVALALVCGSAAADTDPCRVFGGKIMISDKVFMSHAKSTSAFGANVRRQAKTQLWEDKAKGTWKVYFAAFFKRPLNDIEVVVKLYDVGG